MWVGCKLQSVLKIINCTLVCFALSMPRGLRFGCFEIESESIFSGTCVVE